MGISEGKIQDSAFKNVSLSYSIFSHVMKPQVWYMAKDSYWRAPMATNSEPGPFLEPTLSFSPHPVRPIVHFCTDSSWKVWFDIRVMNSHVAYFGKKLLDVLSVSVGWEDTCFTGVEVPWNGSTWHQNRLYSMLWAGLVAVYAKATYCFEEWLDSSIKQIACTLRCDRIENRENWVSGVNLHEIHKQLCISWVWFRIKNKVKKTYNVDSLL